jgi:hypothetical protein
MDNTFGPKSALSPGAAGLVLSLLSGTPTRTNLQFLGKGCLAASARLLRGRLPSSAMGMETLVVGNRLDPSYTSSLGEMSRF